MPYKLEKHGDKWRVVNSATGKSHGDSDSESAGKAHMRAMYASEGKKSYDSWDIYSNQISPQEADYFPLGGDNKQACAACQFFSSPDGCLIVQGDISPTGICRHYTDKIVWSPEPIPVYVVDVDSGVKANDSDLGLADKVKSWFTSLVSPSTSQPVADGLRPIYYQPENNRVWMIGSNNFEDRHDETIPEAVHQDYIKWVQETGLYPDFHMWHLGEKTKWGQADTVARVNNFTIFSGPVDPGYEDFAQACADDPNTCVSHGYFALKSADNKEFVLWRPYELSPLPLSEAANVWMGDGEALKLEGYMPINEETKALLKSKGASDDFISQLDGFTSARGTQVTNQGVGSKEVEPKPDPSPDPKPDPTPPPTVEAGGNATPSGSITLESITQAVAGVVAPIMTRITALEENQKSFETKLGKTQEDLVAEQLSSQISIAASQGFKASETPNNVINPADETNELSWLAKDLDQLMAAGGLAPRSN